jgi:hypothetical protein
MPGFFRRAVATAIITMPLSHASARSDVYRCVQDDGHISYQQIPCHANSEPIKLNHRPSGWTPLRPGERALLDSYRKKDTSQSRKPDGQVKNAASEAKSCWKKRRQLDAVRLKLRRGYKLKEGDQLKRKRDNYADYLRQFCS